MKYLEALLIYAFLGSLIAGCADVINFSGGKASSPPPPAEEILINNEEFEKPHRVLGSVQYTLKSRPSIFTNQLDLREQAIDLLKQQTYAKYGDEVDAITDTKVSESITQDAEGKINIVNIQGIAISFIDEPVAQPKGNKPDDKANVKRKHKSAKKILILKKEKPAKPSKKSLERPVVNSPEKTRTTKKKEEEIEITPSEILK